EVGVELPGQAHAVLPGLRLGQTVAREGEHVAHQLSVLLVVLHDQDQLVGHVFTGSVNVKTEPRPTSLFTPRVPPCSSTNFRVSVSPRPVPSRLPAWSGPAWRNSSKMSPWSA